MLFGASLKRPAKDRGGSLLPLRVIVALILNISSCQGLILDHAGGPAARRSGCVSAADAHAEAGPGRPCSQRHQLAPGPVREEARCTCCIVTAVRCSPLLYC
jgi:hypothetical protein